MGGKGQTTDWDTHRPQEGEGHAISASGTVSGARVAEAAVDNIGTGVFDGSGGVEARGWDAAKWFDNL
jgi:phosphoribosylanthranilate isomerase